MFVATRKWSSEWVRLNPVLINGEIGQEINTGRLKIGDGRTPWIDLTYVYGPGGEASGPISIEDITNAGTTGKSVLAAESASLARAAIGAGVSNLTIGTGPTDAKRGDYVPTYAELGTVPTAYLPPLVITETSVVASEAAMLALTAQRGDVAIRSDTGKTYILAADAPATLSNWKELPAVGSMTSVNGKVGVVLLTISDIPNLQTSLDQKINLSDMDEVDVYTKGEVDNLIRVALGRPGQVATISQTISGTSITVSWTAPTDPGGSALTGYYAGCSAGLNSSNVLPAEQGPLSTSTLSATFTGLVAGNTYTFYVEAANAAGRGARRSISVQIPAAGGTVLPPSGSAFLGPWAFTETDASKPSIWTANYFTNSYPTANSDYGFNGGRAYISTPAAAWAGTGRYFFPGVDANYQNFDLFMDVDVRRAVAGTSVFQGLNLNVRHSESVTGNDGLPYSGYRLFIRETGWQLIKRIASTDTVLFTGNQFTENTVRRYRFRLYGTSIAVKSWAVGDTEPAAWDWVGTDTERTNGVRPFIYTSNGNVTTRSTVYFDNLVVYPATTANV